MRSPKRLAYVDPNQPRGWFSRAYAALANTRLGRFLSVHVVWRLDPYLMRVASKLGLPSNPAWFHNLRADPDVSFGGIPMRAAVVSEVAERRRLWALADRVFAPYAAYRREAAKANREIPIVQLTARRPEAA